MLDLQLAAAMRAATRLLRRRPVPKHVRHAAAIKTFDDQFDYLREILNSRVYDAAVETPLQHAAKLSSITNCDAYVKREDLQPVFSFKIRGAYNRIVNLGDVKGVVACSAGNHAQGVAKSCSILNLPAVIVMPLATPCVEINILRRVPPRHRRDACSIAWRCRFLAARRARTAASSPRNDLVHPTHWLISTQVPTTRAGSATASAIASMESVDVFDGTLDGEMFEAHLARNPKLVAFTHVSNALGTVNDVKHWTSRAHDAGATVLVDGAQSVPHLPVNVRDLDVDFYMFSGHKTYGPTGIGILYGKEALLDAMPPYRGGGEMIGTVSFEKGTTYNELPYKFEAGTPHISGGIALGAALDWMNGVGMPALTAHEHDLTHHAHAQLEGIKGLRFYGTAPCKAGAEGCRCDASDGGLVGGAASRRATTRFIILLSAGSSESYSRQNVSSLG